jgi:hypothetical protein
LPNDLAFGDAVQPAPVLGTQPLFDEPEVRPKNVRDNRIGAGDVDDGGEKLRHSQFGAPEFGG